jgi:rod shape-determining protein MreD
VKGSKLIAATFVCLWLAGGFQTAIAPRLAIGTVMPDFLLVALGSLALLGTRRSGAVTGFAAGVLQGAIAGANMAQYVLSRTIAGFFTGWLTAWEFEATIVVAFFSVAFATLTSQLLLLFMAPPPRILGFLLATIGSAIYNGVLAMPLFALLKRIMK